MTLVGGGMEGGSRRSIPEDHHQLPRRPGIHVLAGLGYFAVMVEWNRFGSRLQAEIDARI